ncbi:MAG: aldo/keto reductase [Oscillospiraceae bacterium]|nr:aldo/keto reductase [Oscillospiraceae bacterium]
MKTITLGRTGIKTTIAGLGCGGFSRIGLEKYGQAHAARIARRAYDLGIRFFDTATAYGTEAAVGEGLAGLPRDSYHISTKYPIWNEWRENYAKRFNETLDESLRLLKTDYIDVYNIHAVSKADYNDVRDMLVPEMKKAQERGKIRFLGVTEGFVSDTAHEMFDIALDDDVFDVIMTGYNIMNPSAAKKVLPRAIKNNVGVLCMFAVRHALANPPQMKADIQKILDNNQGGPGLEAAESALDFLTKPDADGLQVAKSIMDAAYRFCAHTQGVHVTLTGTSSEKHLAANIDSIASTKLPHDALEKLEQLFGLSDCVSGQ